MSVPLPEPIHAYIRRFIARRRGAAVVKSGGYAVAIALAWMLLACLLDRLLQLPKPLRLAMLIVGLVAAAGPLIRPLIYLLFRRINWLEAAVAVELANPAFAGRLCTIVSQFTERSEYRGSPQMLEQLLAEVTQHAEQDRSRQGISWPVVLRPWGQAGGLLLATGLLCLLPSLDMPTLIQRFLLPQAAIAPVTRTRVFIEPGDVSLVRGSPLMIRARVERLDGAAVEIFTSSNTASWSRMPMLRGSDGRYSFNLSLVDRDLYYYVRAGDAKTETYKARVLHAPAVSQFRLRYDYPSYTQRSALDVVSSDGVIEALVGTKVQLSLVSTQPLRSASLWLANQPLPMTASADPAIWQTHLLVEKDQTLSLEMVSAGGLTAKVPNALSIRTQPDRKPLLRLLQPTGDLRLHPRALPNVHYQAMDDYGIIDLTLAVQVNSSPVRSVPIPRRADPRRIDDHTVLDLATLAVSVGDVVTFKLVARDGPGNTVTSDTCHILISPRSIDINTHLRIAELRQSAQLAATMHNELIQSAELLDAAIRSDGVGAEYITVRVKASGRLSGALEASLLLHQSLLRACGKIVSSEQAIALADCIDRARVQASACERVTNADTRGDSERAIITRVKELARAAQELSSRIKTLSEGEQAAAILADRANITTSRASQSPDPAAAQRLEETLRRAQEDINWAVGELGLNPKASDLDAALQRKVDSANQLARSCRPIDFAEAAAAWLVALERDSAAAPPLPERLTSACSVEAARPDRDSVAAYDLQLASRVASTLAQTPQVPEPHMGDLVRIIRLEFAQTLAALQLEHRIRRQIQPSLSAEQLQAVRNAGAEARKRLANWAAPPDNSLAADTVPPISPEELAMQANARTTDRDYAAADSIDRQFLAHVASELADPAGAAHELNRTVTRVRRIDEVSIEQQALTRQTAALQAETAQNALRLSEQQQQVAERIYRIDEMDDRRPNLATNADSRRLATAAIQQIQEELARMPQLLTAALQAAEVYRQAVVQAEEAQQKFKTASAANQALAQRNAEQAARAVWDAEDELVEVGSFLAPDGANGMAKMLRSYRPETDGAISAIAGQLLPSLQSLQQAMHAADKDAVARAAVRVRSAIEATQLRLRDAQGHIIESDPLVTARWFAEAAAQSLAQQPPDVPKARGHQQTASVALGRAWQGAVRDVASVRLSMTPGYRPIMGTQSSSASIARSVGSLIEMLPGLHQWSFLRPRQPEALNAPVRDSEPAGYQDALRVYFEYLGKNQQPSPGK